jgi:hypothetical protein
MYDTVKNVTITYHIKKKSFFFTLHGFPREISVSVFLIYVNDAESAIVYFPALL